MYLLKIVHDTEIILLMHRDDNQWLGCSVLSCGLCGIITKISLKCTRFLGHLI